MNNLVNISIDGTQYQVREGKNLVDAARENGIYIPTLCHFHEVNPPLGTCRICTVIVNNKTTTSCTTKVYEGMEVEINTPELINTRKAIIEMLFAEGNHFCPSCEKSGNCDMQNLAYDMGITVTRFPHVYSNKAVDFNSDRMIMESNRCILCKRCVANIQTKDGKDVFSLLFSKMSTDHYLIEILSVSIIFMMINLGFTSILQALNHEKVPVRNMYIGLIIKLISSFVLLSIPTITLCLRSQGTARSRYASGLVVEANPPVYSPGAR